MKEKWCIVASACTRACQTFHMYAARSAADTLHAWPPLSVRITVTTMRQKNMMLFFPCCLLPPVYHTGWGLQRHLQGMWHLMSALKKVRWLRTLHCSTFAADRTGPIGPIICGAAAMNVSMPRNPPNHVCLGSSDIWMLMPNVLKIRWTSRAIFKTIFNVNGLPPW